MPPSRNEDPLGRALGLLQLTGTLYCSAELGAPWGVAVPRLDGAMAFQLVTAGECWLTVKGASPQRLSAGSLTVLPHGTAHDFRSEPHAALTALDELPVERLNERFEVLRYGGQGASTRVLYGVARYDAAVASRLLAALPPLLHIHAWSDEASGWLQSTARFAAYEAAALLPGAECVITRLADILLVQALREWLAQTPQVGSGWVAALRDPQLGQALAALHGAPERGWTLSELAAKAGMSRSVFAARFTQVMSEPPMRYLSRLRLGLARAQLQQERETLASLAERFGYQSEAAFGRAFRREFGISPGRVRKQQAVRVPELVEVGSAFGSRSRT